MEMQKEKEESTLELILLEKKKDLNPLHHLRIKTERKKLKLR
jgi:hypothetical protein